MPQSRSLLLLPAHSRSKPDPFRRHRPAGRNHHHHHRRGHCRGVNCQTVRKVVVAGVAFAFVTTTAWFLLVWQWPHQLPPTQWLPLTTTTTQTTTTMATTTTTPARHPQPQFLGERARPNVEPKDAGSMLQHSVSTAAATFNNVPVTFVSYPTPPESLALRYHCVSSSSPHSPSTTTAPTGTAWMYRTCRYTHLCFDTATHEYVGFVVDNNNTNTNVASSSSSSSRSSSRSSGGSSTVPSVALGGINPRWGSGVGPDRNIDKVRWRPTLFPLRPTTVTTPVSTTAGHSYYQLEDDTVLIAFHSMAGHNVGHLLWDDLFAIYTALRMTGYLSPPSSVETLPPHRRFLLIRHVLTGEKKLYANCDIRHNKRKQCKENFERFLPLFGVDPLTFSTSKTARLSGRGLQGDATVAAAGDTAKPPLTTTLVCAKTAVAGMGLLTDHGFRDHGWDFHQDQNTTAWTVPHNLGRGRLFFDFSRFLILNNVNDNNNNNITNSYLPTATISAPAATRVQQSPKGPVLLPPWPPQITFSVRSSRDWSRRLNFTSQIRALASLSRLGGDIGYSVQAYEVRDLSLEEQIELAARTSIFVTACGGGSMTATFLPRNAVLIVFYDAVGGMDFDKNFQSNQQPARLDWDLLNNAAHLRVHWLPANFMDDRDHVELFVRLIQHELAILRRMRAAESQVD